MPEPSSQSHAGIAFGAGVIATPMPPRMDVELLAGSMTVQVSEHRVAR